MQGRIGRSRSRLVGAVTVAVVLAGASASLLAAPVQAQAASLQQQQDELRREETAKAVEVDALTADADAVDAAITALDAEVARQQARADDAETNVRSVQAELVQAGNQKAEADATLAALRIELADAALSAYVRPPFDDLATVLADEDPSAGAKRTVLAATHTSSVADVIDEIRAASERARRAGLRAASALVAAREAAAQEQRVLAELDGSLAAQQSLADDVQVRLDRALGEAAVISARSQDLADQISSRERQLASRVGSGSGGTRPSWVSSGVRVSTVGGITVDASIASSLAALLVDAEADGVYLGGYGYRDISTQIELRMEHCGTSEYAIWAMNSMDCSPPVARPGYSMHEQGLAVDFLVGGDLIRSRSTSAYQWLAANAAGYGLYNLPSEPWHWSTTGS